MTQKSKSAGMELDVKIKSTADDKNYIIDDLIRECVSNAAFYDTDKSFVGTKMHASFLKATKYLEKLVPVTKTVEEFATIYDFDENTPGNGYRSFVYIFNSAVEHASKISKYIINNRGNLLFRKSNYMK
jgi:hormone-sensitive lipase